jgi:peptidoglycan/LPS O-acetylase OafA/YrhL
MNFINGYLNVDLKSRISKYRQPLMGFAILWIFMLHSGKTGNIFYDAIRVYGWAGVDIFFFLSAIGLCYSLSRDNNIFNFYGKRIKRILPTWIFVLIIVHLAGLVCNHFMPKLPFYVPNTLTKCITWYTGFGFWISDFVSGKGWFYEWYVPSLLMFYAFTPWLYKRKPITLIILILLTISLGITLTFGHYIHNIHFFYQRIPVFILGIYYFYIISCDDNRKFNISLIIGFFIGIAMVIIRNSCNILLPDCYIVLFLLPLALILLSYLFEFKYIKKVFAFYGSISLELYLIHLYRRPHYLVSFFVNNKFLIILFALFLCTFVAYMLHLVINRNKPKEVIVLN